MGAMTAIAGVGALASGIQAISGAKQRRDLRTAFENYERQNLENIAKGLQVSTLGADLQREEQARMASSQVSALQGAGVRGLVGGLGRVEAGNQMANREIAANLDAQQKQIDQMYAQDEANIRGMQEQREMGDIAGLSSQYNAGNAMMWQGIGGIAQSGMAAIGGGVFGKGEGGKGVEGIAKTSEQGTEVLGNSSNKMNEVFSGLNNPMTKTGGSGLGAMNYLENQPLFNSYNIPSFTAPVQRRSNISDSMRGYSVDPYTGNLIFE